MAEPAAGGQGVAEQDQQSAYRGQQHRNRLQWKGRTQGDGVRVLPPQGPGSDTDPDETGDGHDRRRAEERPSQAELVAEEVHHQHRRGGLAGDPQQHNKIDVAGPFGDEPAEPHRAGALVADELLDPCHGHRADGCVDRRKQSTQQDQCECTRQRCQSVQLSQPVSGRSVVTCRAADGPARAAGPCGRRRPARRPTPREAGAARRTSPSPRPARRGRNPADATRHAP